MMCHSCYRSAYQPSEFYPNLRDGSRTGRLRLRSKDRKAWFTARSLGNARATCGSRTTIFDEAATFAAYFPRTSSPKSERLYSARSSSFDFRLTFFIIEKGDDGRSQLCTLPADQIVEHPGSIPPRVPQHAPPISLSGMSNQKLLLNECLSLHQQCGSAAALRLAVRRWLHPLVS